MRMLLGLVLMALVSVCTAYDPAESFAKMHRDMQRNIVESMRSMQTQWETIQPRSKEECLRESGGVLDNRFVRCRNGRQELVRYSQDGRREVVQERPIPY